jgi:hypothetical protein
MARAFIIVALLFLIAGSRSTAAQGEPTAKLQVGFSPYELGQGTNVSFNIHITSRNRELVPLTGIDFRYPEQLGVAVSGLGLLACQRATLELQGPAGCPIDSRVGQGSAIAEVPLGSPPIREAAKITILRAPEHEGHIALFFFVSAGEPVITELILRGVLTAGPAPYETIHVAIPPVATVPDGPDVAVVQLQASIGPRDIVYYEERGRKRVPYTPRGVLLPNICPRHGFRFNAIVAFANGGYAAPHTTIKCHHG